MLAQLILFQFIIIFFKGVIISSKESLDLSYHRSPWYEQIYTIIDEDGKEYTATYGNAFISSFFIRTMEDHIERVKYSIQDNNKKIDDLNKENELLNSALNHLMQMNAANETLSKYEGSKKTRVKVKCLKKKNKN